MKAKKKPRSNRVASDDLLGATDPFFRLLKLIEPLGLSNSKPLKEVLPGLWPNLGELRTLVKAARKKQWCCKDGMRLGMMVCPECEEISRGYSAAMVSVPNK